MNKCHVPITWVNDQAPAINDTHLNQYDGELDTLDDRVITLDTTKANQSDLLTCVASVTLNTTTGIMTITLKNGSATTFDTGLAKLAVNFDYDEDPTSPHYQQLILEMKDGTYKYIDLSALITQFEFDNTSTIGFSVDADGHVKANVLDGSITSSKLDPTFAVTIADAEANGLKSEGYANGTQNGTPVTSGSPYYENNAKYWKEQAQAIASASLSGLSDVSITNPQDGDLLAYDADNSEWVNSSDVRDNLNEIIEELGNKNVNSYPYYSTTMSQNGIIFTDNGDGTVTASGLASADAKFICHHRYEPSNALILPNGNYIGSGIPTGGSASTFCAEYDLTKNGGYYNLGYDYGSGFSFTLNGDDAHVDSAQLQIVLIVKSGTNLSTPITFKPMVRDASISDDTWVPYGESKFVEKKDLTSIIATGATNTTGATITAGTYFYLNGTLVRAKVDIANGASYTSGTNYETAVIQDAIKDSGWKALASSITDLTMEYRKVGELVALDINIKYGVLSGSWQTCGTLPTGYRPRTNIYQDVLHMDSINVIAYVATGGEIQVKGSNSNSSINTELLFFTA